MKQTKAPEWLWTSHLTSLNPTCLFRRNVQMEPCSFSSGSLLIVSEQKLMPLHNIFVERLSTTTQIYTYTCIQTYMCPGIICTRNYTIKFFVVCLLNLPLAIWFIYYCISPGNILSKHTGSTPLPSSNPCQAWHCRQWPADFDWVAFKGWFYRLDDEAGVSH